MSKITKTQIQLLQNIKTHTCLTACFQDDLGKMALEKLNHSGL